MNCTDKVEKRYSLEEKRIILNQLNEERIRNQNKKENAHMLLSKYHPKEKSDILEKLDKKRRRNQEKKRLHKCTFGNKKIYTLENREFYKILDLGRDYYIKIEDCQNHSYRPELITLYHQGFDGLKKTKVLVKFRTDTDKIYISEDALRVYFKASSLEEIES